MAVDFLSDAVAARYGRFDGPPAPVVVWVAVDQRGPASVYIATDSRIIWPAGPTGATQWDGARKTYSTTKLAHIMGYVGDVLFPALTLPTVAAQLDECPHGESVEVAQERVLELVRTAWRDAPSSARLESRLVHCTRVGAGMKARFSVQVLHLPAGMTEWTATCSGTTASQLEDRLLVQRPS